MNPSTPLVVKVTPPLDMPVESGDRLVVTASPLHLLIRVAPVPREEESDDSDVLQLVKCVSDEAGDQFETTTHLSINWIWDRLAGRTAVDQVPDRITPLVTDLRFYSDEGENMAFLLSRAGELEYYRAWLKYFEARVDLYAHDRWGTGTHSLVAAFRLTTDLESLRGQVLLAATPFYLHVEIARFLWTNQVCRTQTSDDIIWQEPDIPRDSHWIATGRTGSPQAGVVRMKPPATARGS